MEVVDMIMSQAVKVVVIVKVKLMMNHPTRNLIKILTKRSQKRKLKKSHKKP